MTQESFYDRSMHGGGDRSKLYGRETASINETAESKGTSKERMTSKYPTGDKKDVTTIGRSLMAGKKKVKKKVTQPREANDYILERRQLNASPVLSMGQESQLLSQNESN